MPNTVITQSGLDFVTSAHDDGVFLAVKYFAPVYVYELDDNCHDGVNTSAVDVSAIFTSAWATSATSPYGEVIYNRGQTNLYDISQDLIVSGGTISPGTAGVGNTVSDATVSQKAYVNLYDDVPLSDSISGSSIVHDGNNHIWYVSAYDPETGSNTPPASVKGRYFPVVDYYPVTSSADSGGSLRGSFKARINGRYGRFQFNSVGLWAVRYEDGEETADAPVFFGQAFLNEPVIKTNISENGFDDVLIDCQFDIQSLSYNWTDVFYATSADYLSRTPSVSGSALYSSDPIGIGTFEDTSNTVRASLQVRKTRQTNTLPQLRLDYDNDNSMLLDVLSGGDVMLTSQGWGTDYCGSTSGSPSLAAEYTIYPHDGRRLSLGKTPGNEFRSLHLNAQDQEHALTIGKSSSLYYSNPEMMLGRNATSATTAMWMLDSYDIEAAAGTGDGTGSMLRNFDITRSDLGRLTVTTTYCGTSVDATYTDMYIAAGVSAESSTHAGLLLNLSGDNPENVLHNDSTLNLFGRGGIKMIGPMEIATRQDAYAGYSFDNGLIYTRDNDLILMAGVDSSTNTRQINAYAEDGTDFCGLTEGGEHNRLFLVGNEIRTQGSIIPHVADTDNIGSTSRRIATLYVDKLDSDISDTHINGLSDGDSSSVSNYIGAFEVYRSVTKSSTDGALVGSTILRPRSTSRIVNGLNIIEQVDIGSDSDKFSHIYANNCDIGYGDYNTVVSTTMWSSDGVRSGQIDGSYDTTSLKWCVLTGITPSYPSSYVGRTIEIDKNIHIDNFLGMVMHIRNAANDGYLPDRYYSLIIRSNSSSYVYFNIFYEQNASGQALASRPYTLIIYYK